jgi:hypothetical protein
MLRRGLPDWGNRELYINQPIIQFSSWELAYRFERNESAIGYIGSLPRLRCSGC